jgi:hypothetical protein
MTTLNYIFTELWPDQIYYRSEAWTIRNQDINNEIFGFHSDEDYETT